MPGYYTLAQGNSGKFTFNLKSGNHQAYQAVLTSEAYESRAAALAGIASVQKNAASESQFERKSAKNGELYFVLKAANGQVIGRSETYPTAAAMEKGIRSVMANGASTDVREA